MDELIVELRKLFDGLDKSDEDRESFERILGGLEEASDSAEDADSDDSGSREVEVDLSPVADAVGKIGETFSESLEGLRTAIDARLEKLENDLEESRSASEDSDESDESDEDSDQGSDEGPEYMRTLTESLKEVKDQIKELKDSTARPKGRRGADSDDDVSQTKRINQAIEKIREQRGPQEAMTARFKVAAQEWDLSDLESRVGA